jgi:hypothetical protein
MANVSLGSIVFNFDHTVLVKGQVADVITPKIKKSGQAALFI